MSQYKSTRPLEWYKARRFGVKQHSRFSYARHLCYSFRAGLLLGPLVKHFLCLLLQPISFYTVIGLPPKLRKVNTRAQRFALANGNYSKPIIREFLRDIPRRAHS